MLPKYSENRPGPVQLHAVLELCRRQSQKDLPSKTHSNPLPLGATSLYYHSPDPVS